MSSALKLIAFKVATEMLRQPGCILIEMKTKTRDGHEFYIVPGGPVSEETAQKILEHPLCHKVDSGLFPGISQSWSLYSG